MPTSSCKFSIVSLLFILITFLAACNSKVSHETEVSSEIVTDTFNEVPPPPNDLLKTVPQSFEQSIETFFASKQVVKDSMFFHLGHFDFNDLDRYVLFLQSIDRDKQSNDTIANPIQYFLLDKVPYKGLDWSNIVAKMRQDLLAFTNTERFNRSTLKQAKYLAFRFDDEETLVIKQ